MRRVTSKGWLASALLATMAAAWWWALEPSTYRPLSAGSNPDVRAPAGPAEAPPAVALDRLRHWESSSASPGATDRDPFGGRLARGGSETSSSTNAAGRALAASLADPAPSTGASWPRLDLIGLGERTTDGKRERVAILSGERGVLHVRAGELIERVYRVERVGDDAVEIRLLPEDRTFRLALRP